MLFLLLDLLRVSLEYKTLSELHRLDLRDFSAAEISENIFIDFILNCSFSNSFIYVWIPYTRNIKVKLPMQLTWHSAFKLKMNILAQMPLPVLAPLVNQQMFSLSNSDSWTESYHSVEKVVVGYVSHDVWKQY